MKTAFFTICSNNYLAYARTLFESLRRSGESGEAFCFLADDRGGDNLYEGAPFRVVLASDCGVPSFWDMAFRYDVMELNTALKPFCIRYLFDELHFERVVYVDPDLYFLSPIAEVHEAFARGAEVILTPHICAPLEDGYDPDDLRIMQTGIYNLGFGGWRNSPASRELVDWWCRRLLEGCVVDLPRGIFVDQKYMDMAPAFVERTCILRHPGYNLAYWNLAHRSVRMAGGEWLANEQPLRFVHFSGVVPADRTIFSKHQNRYAASDIGPLRALLNEYLDRLSANGMEASSAIPYAYNRLANGDPIIPEMRALYRRLTRSNTRSRAELFGEDYAIYNAVTPALPTDRQAPITNMMYEVWCARPDLQSAFPLQSRGDRFEFLRWWADTAAKEHNVTTPMLEPASDALRHRPAKRGQAHRPYRARRLASEIERTIANVTTRVGFSRDLGIRRTYRRLPIVWRIRVREFLGLPVPRGASTLRFLESTVQLSRGASQAPRRSLRHGAGVFGYLNMASGVGEAGRRTYQALARVEIPCSAHGIPGHAPTPGSSIYPVGGVSDYYVNIFQLNADNTMMLDSLVDVRNLEGTYRIGYWAWELPVFPRAWLAALENVDEIWAPSEFVAHAVRQCTKKPVFRVPHPVPERASPYMDRKSFGLPEGALVFLSAFDFNSFAARKNPLGSITAFREAFPRGREGNEVLVVKCHGQGAGKQARDEMVSRLRAEPDIIVIDETLSPEEMLGLQSQSDVFLSLHRSEGFGLNIAEMMLLGKPVVATNFSGNVDFLDDTCGMPIGFSMVPVREGEYPFGKGQWWSEPDIASAATAIKRLAADRDLRKSLGDRGRARMLERFSYQVVGRKMAERIDQICLLRGIDRAT